MSMSYGEKRVHPSSSFPPDLKIIGGGVSTSLLMGLWKHFILLPANNSKTIIGVDYTLFNLNKSPSYRLSKLHGGYPPVVMGALQTVTS